MTTSYTYTRIFFPFQIAVDKVHQFLPLSLLFMIWPNIFIAILLYLLDLSKIFGSFQIKSEITSYTTCEKNYAKLHLNIYCKNNYFSHVSVCTLYIYYWMAMNYYWTIFLLPYMLTKCNVHQDFSNYTVRHTVPPHSSLILYN